jgi:glutamate/tyrosine decarboxylase-like PLP-dependent enzyme
MPPGRPVDAVLAELAAMTEGDADWRGGRTFSLVYNADDDELAHLHDEVGRRFLAENALNPFAFPSLVRMEHEVVEVAKGLVHLAGGGGTMSSGGTESIFLAVHTAREWARERGVEQPAIVTARTAHPAFAKACHYLGVEERRVELRPDLRADPAAMAAAVDDRVALLVASAPCYPFGVIDPVPEIAGLAAERGLLCHVDACLGGWLLPFWEQLGEPVPPWDFRVPGVTSMSADVHKYGYAFKGASVILHRDAEMVRRQWFLFDDWPGGLYGSATTAGTRPAAPIAGAWATIRHLGADGFLAKARVVRDTTRRFQEGIGAIPGLSITAAPDLSVLEIGSDTLDLAAVGDAMDERGWHLDRQQGGLHLMVSPYHARIVDAFVADLTEAAATDRSGSGSGSGSDGTYGAVPPS